MDIFVGKGRKIGYFGLRKSNEFANCKLHSTIPSLMNVTDTWYKYIEGKRSNVSLFLDLRKAFDSINHSIPLSKIGKYGIAQNKLAWFTSYLTDRKQYCYLGGKTLRNRRSPVAFRKGNVWGLFYSFLTRIILKVPYQHSTPIYMLMIQVSPLVVKIPYN